MPEVSTQHKISLLGKKWLILNTNSEISLFEALCQNRGLVSSDEQKAFFENFQGDQYFDPYLLKGMLEAVARIQEALNREEKIMIYGDYDVDGMTSTAIMYKTLEHLGASVSYRLPDRVKDGYGLNMRYVEECATLNVDLIITVDCGSSNIREISAARALGIEVIVVDHHTVPDNFSDETVIFINPKQKDCPYPFKDVCGAMLAYKLAYTLLKENKTEVIETALIQELQDLAILGTVADCMPLCSENRAMVKKGVGQLKNTPNKGLQALYKVARVDLENISSFTLGFMIGPRLNAAGRIHSPYTGLQLLLGKTENAEFLDQLNRERQDMVELFLKEAEIQVQEDLLHHKKILVVASEQWHIGLVGLIAGKLAQKYARPCIAMQKKGDFFIGSARSVGNIDIMQLMHHCQDHFSHYGGHRQASGFSLYADQLETFTEQLQLFAEEIIQDEMIIPVLNIDSEITEQDIKLKTIQDLKQFAPFGMANSEPLFVVKKALLQEIKCVGQNNKHLKCRVKVGDQILSAIGFHLGSHETLLQEHNQLDIACHLELNEWNNKKEIQLRIVDLMLNS